MLVDSEPHNECNHSLNWVMVGKAKQKGGVKWASTPNVKRNDNICLLFDTEYSHSPEEGPTPPVER